MFKLNRHKSDRSYGGRVEFKLSNFEAFQVPKGWDKLLLSVVSVETGKTIARSSKATVHHGACQWTETFSESIWSYQDDTSKELEECLYKITIAMGSARSGILGEVILNLTDHMSSRDSDLISLPLKKCSHGTILQIKIQCHTPRTNSREKKSWKQIPDDPQTNHEDMDNKSDGSDNILNKSIGSSSSSHLGISSYQDELANRDASFSASGSHRSSDSGGSPIGRANLSPMNSSNGRGYMGRQDSAGSHISATSAPGAGDEFSRSNPSSFNSRASVSSIHTNQWQEMTSQASPHGIAPLPLRPSDSSKDLLEAAEETIEELLDEAKMWERHSQKLKLDIDKLKREYSDKFKHQADMEIELSSACAERDSLRQEVEWLKSSLQEFMEKQTINDTGKTNEMLQVQNELEDEVRYQKEANATLNLQLKKTQDANIELVSILQELEETVEKQNSEIANLSQSCHVDEHEDGVSSQTWLDIEAEWGIILSSKEEELRNLEEKLSSILNAEHRSEQVCDRGNPDLIKEIEDLKAKVQELEKDCAELTDENLELVLKMKETVEDTRDQGSFHTSTFNGSKINISTDDPEFKVGLFKSQSSLPEEELTEKEILIEELTMPLKFQVKCLEDKCAGLELEVQHFKEQASNLNIELQKSQTEVKKRIQEFADLQEKLACFQGRESECFDSDKGRNIEEIETRNSPEWSCKLSEINKQLYLALSHVKRPHLVGESGVITDHINDSDLVRLGYNTAVAENEQAEAVLKHILELNTLLGVNTTDDVNFTGGQEHINNNILEEHRHQKLIGRVNSGSENTDEEMEIRKSEREDLKSCLLLKEKDINALRDANRELEDQISSTQIEKNELEEKLVVALRESTITCNNLNNVQNDLMLLSKDMDFQLSTNKILERKSFDLESSKHELELHISELEVENIQLSERISGLEAQLRYLTNEKESNRLEVEESRSLVIDLKNEIAEQQTELETHKTELKRKLQDAQKRLEEAQEETEYLKRSHSKLQVTRESLIEDCSSLQKLTGDLRRQKNELHERSTRLEVELNESLKKNVTFYKKIEFLETKFLSLQTEIASRENSLISQLDSIFQDHKGHGEKISQAYLLLNHMDLAKRIEIENLERHVEHLSLQLSSNDGERENRASDAVIEVFTLRSENSKLESSLQQALAKVKFYETEMHSINLESENKVQGLVDLINASKQSEEMLMADIERMQRLMDSLRTSEEKFRRTANELELRLRASDYEKQLIMEETSGLQVQLQKIALLQDEILTLRNSLDETKFERGKLEESLQLISEECEELKTERVSFMKKISNMQKALDDGGDERRGRVSLEEKLLRLEGDLTARQASYAHEAELKNELNRVKRANSEYQRKIQTLEEEKDKFLRKCQELEKELVLVKEQKQDEVLYEGENKLQDHMENTQIIKEEDFASRICSLKDELAQALETSNMYKLQLASYLSEQQNGGTKLFTKPVSENDKRPDSADREASLEAELKEMEERYLHMSLRYAEVEAHREELVMQLKSAKQGKKWFS